MRYLSLIYFYLSLAVFLTLVLPVIGALLQRGKLGLKLLSKTFIEIGKYSSLVNTLLHEISHCVCSWITGGRAHAISLHHDASGLAITSTRSWGARVLVAYGGYTGASLSSLGLFYLLYKGYYEFILYFFSVVAFIGLLLWIGNLVRFIKGSFLSFFKSINYKGNPNFYGLVWSISFLLLLGFVLYKHYQTVIIHISIFLASVVFVQSIYTAYIILKLSITQRKDAGDATSLAQATFIPALFWGLLFFSQSLLAGYYIFEHYIYI